MAKWEKIGNVAPPRYGSMYGLKGKKDVVWLDNWGKGNWAVVKGKELKPMTYKEDAVILNTGSKKDALATLKRFMKSGM
jgi:hypothetical protein